MNKIIIVFMSFIIFTLPVYANNIIILAAKDAPAPMPINEIPPQNSAEIALPENEGNFGLPANNFPYTNLYQPSYARVDHQNNGFMQVYFDATSSTIGAAGNAGSTYSISVAGVGADAIFESFAISEKSSLQKNYSPFLCIVIGNSKFINTASSIIRDFKDGDSIIVASKNQKEMTKNGNNLTQTCSKIELIRKGTKAQSAYN